MALAVKDIPNLLAAFPASRTKNGRLCFFDRKLLFTMLRFALPSALQQSIVSVGSVVVQATINSFGASVIAGTAAASKVINLVIAIPINYSNAYSAYVGQNMGAGKPERVRQGVRHANIIVTIISTVLIVLVYTCARPVFQWVTSTTNPNIIDASVMYAQISVLFFYALGPLFVFRCTLQGMGRKIVPLISSVTEMLVKIFSAMFLVPAFAYKGVAFTEPISWVLMTIILAVAYYTGKPENYVKVEE